MSLVQIPKGVPPPLPETAAIKYSFPLDPFQLHAIHAIENNQHVLVTAKTGSGKTLVGEYQIAYSLKKKQRIFYTTPIKSLSNQKFKDLKELFPTASVGLLTGDIKFAPEADIVVMTTEILRNLLYKQSTPTANLGIAGTISLRDVGAVIFDEVHYINDPDRGHVWEETIVLLPKEIQMILLSATIDSAYEFANWIGRIKETPITLLSTTHRVVPLIHGMYVPKGAPLATTALPMLSLKDSDESAFKSDHYHMWNLAKDRNAEAVAKWKRTVDATKRAGESMTAEQNAAKPRIYSFPHRLNECITNLQEKSLCPAIFFVFSRNDCRKYARCVETSLISSSDAATVRHLYEFHLHKYKSMLEGFEQYHEMLDLVQKGIAFHHSGVLPLLKEVIELLFGKGLIKVLFATETFAVGLNMPARTVVFTDLRKPSESGLRPLRTDEYTQMAGRAGRRGKDTQGIVLHLPAHDPLTMEEMRNVLSGPLVPLRSRMQFGYDFVLKALWKSKEASTSILTKSYWTVQQEAAQRALEGELKAAQERIILPSEEETHQIKLREKLEEMVRTSRRGALKKAEEALATWKMTHTDSKWDRLWISRKEDAKNRTSLADLQAQVEAPMYDPITPTVQILQEWKYVTADVTLTPKGILATEVNEANPILMVELYTSKLLHTASVETIVTTLATFLEPDRNEFDCAIPSCVDSKVIDLLDSTANTHMKVEEAHGIRSESSWSLSAKWMYIANEWLKGVSAAVLLKELEMFEGNFIKGILTLNQLVREWISLATYDGNIEMLALFVGIEAKLLRDIVVPESLYVK
jgi:superfamily II RNA helicase